MSAGRRVLLAAADSPRLGRFVQRYGFRLGAARFVAGSLAHVSASDPVTLGAATLVLLLVALFAGWVPAHRASRIDPLTSLRQD